MTPQEQELINSVATRLRNANVTEKDAEAEEFIQREIGAQKDSAYLLTQAVIIQEHAMKQAQERISALERELQEAREQNTQTAPERKSSFLGGLFGGGASSSAAGPASRPVDRSDTPPPGQARSANSGFGDFMKSAAAMAVGVAGGHLLFSGLSNMFGSDSETAQAQPETGEPQTQEQETAVADNADADPNLDTGTDFTSGLGLNDPLQLAQETYASPHYNEDEPDFGGEFDMGDDDF